MTIDNADDDPLFVDIPAPTIRVRARVRASPCDADRSLCSRCGGDDAGCYICGRLAQAVAKRRECR